MAIVLADRTVGGRRVSVVASERDDGDVHPIHTGPDLLVERQRAVAGRQWSMADQRHGIELLDVSGQHPDSPIAGVADVVVSAPSSSPVAVWAADCAPLAIVGTDATACVVHAGWRGLASGVIDVAVAAVRERCGEIELVVLGPTIHSCCYEFGRDDLASVAVGTHSSVDAIAGLTAHHTVALDVPAAVHGALAFHGLHLDVMAPCTGCDDRWFSHRVRAEPGRHALVAWSEPFDVAS